MSRSGYSDDLDNWQLICWRGAVASAIRGARGQAFLREMAAELDAMPVRELIRGDLEHDGHYCALGVVAHARGADLSRWVHDEDCYTFDDALAKVFAVAKSLVAEVAYENDDGDYTRKETPSQRWTRMRAWVASQIKDEACLKTS